jgi:phosphoribosylaminoimidazole-succinocarboxamide synthase
MDKGLEITRGKTKTLYEFPGQPDLAIMTQGDTISAGDGVKRHELPGKGRLSALTTARVYRLLNLCGLSTHYIRGGEDDDKNELIVRRCDMIPLEVVVRGVAAGSYAKRRPGMQRGSLLIPRVIEFFFKDDANHDPLIEPEEIIGKGLATPAEVSMMSDLARVAFDVLSHAWRLRDTLLVDLKIEFGRLTSGENKGALIIADVIDNDSWRIWPQGREELMLDKQMYRNMTNPSADDLDRVLGAYEQVAELAGGFPVMRPAMVAVLCGEMDQIQIDPVTRALSSFGLPMVRHLTSMTRTPGHVLSLIQQLEVAFPRLVFVALGSPDFARMIEYTTTAPVYSITPEAKVDDIEALALRVAKSFALDDTVMYGRTILTQGGIRSVVLQADMKLNQPAPNQVQQPVGV